jgi:hypothetical protein
MAATTREARSRIMSAIRKRDTEPELAVRRSRSHMRVAHVGFHNCSREEIVKAKYKVAASGKTSLSALTASRSSSRKSRSCPGSRKRGQGATGKLPVQARTPSAKIAALIDIVTGNKSPPERSNRSQRVASHPALCNAQTAHRPDTYVLGFYFLPCSSA